jgi:hypothetical protein
MATFIVIVGFSLALLLQLNFNSDSNADEEVIESSDGGIVALPSDWTSEDVDMFSDKVEAMLKAIASAEGYYVANSVPQRANNPCDLKVGNIGYGTIKKGVLDLQSKDGITVFPDANSGWARGRHQVVLMLSGKSHVYSLADSFIDVANKYAEGATEWGINVANVLGISPSASLNDFVNG